MLNKKMYSLRLEKIKIKSINDALWEVTSINA